jgi:hypothetical protein
MGESVKFERVARWLALQRKIPLTPDGVPDTSAFGLLMRACQAGELMVTIDEACERRFLGAGPTENLQYKRQLLRSEFPPTRRIVDLIMLCGQLNPDEVGRWLRAEGATPWLDAEKPPPPGPAVLPTVVRRSRQVEEPELLEAVRDCFATGDSSETVVKKVQAKLGISGQRNEIRIVIRLPEFDHLRPQRGIHKSR